jgi:glycosyltransferase involved in cell wall biosynthesis
MEAQPAHDPATPPATGPGDGEHPLALDPSGSGGGSRVLILNWRDTTHPEGGGSEVFVERVAAGLAAQGRLVTLFCAAHPGAPATERVGGVRVLRRGGRLTVYLHAWWAHLSGRLGAHDVVVDVQNGVPFFAALWCRRPLVVLVHHVHREQWRVVMPALRARVGWWVESRVAPRVQRRARYIAVSEATRRELVGLGVRPDAVAVVHNGMAAPGLAEAVPRTPFPSVCVLGRLVPHKRVELALEAAARIRPHLPELKVRVVGQGYWEPRLREAVDRLGLQDAVELLGWVDEATKRRVLASSWALAMPSVKEGWGLAVLEAAASGTPTVAFRSAGGVRESVLHGTTGLLAGNLDEFTRHLAWVLLNRHLRERLGEAARAHAARFTWPEAVAAFAAVLDAATAPEEPEATERPGGEVPAQGRATA